MRKTLAILLSVLATAALFSACGKKQKTDIPAFIETLSYEEREYTFEDGAVLTGAHYVEMDIKGYGTMVLEIDADSAPKSATNFLRLAASGFYDGLTFHRIISGFMAQGGADFEGKHADEIEYITGEFAANGFNNPISHKRGVISMARANDLNSGNSQFFIMHADNTGLDGQYAAFGRVIAGIEVVDEMCKKADPNASNGVQAENKRPVINYVKIIGEKK